MFIGFVRTCNTIQLGYKYLISKIQSVSNIGKCLQVDTTTTVHPSGLESCWGLAVSAPCRTEAGHRSCHCSSIHSSIHYMVFAWFFHAFEAACLVMSGIGVGFSSSFLWASDGDVRHFFGGWFLDRLGLNPAGVGLFRLRAESRPELPPKLPLQLHPQLHPLHGFCVFSCFRSCLSGDVRHWRWPSSSFLWASEGDVRQFFGGWFLDRLGLNPAGVWLFRLRAERRPELPPKLPLQLHPQLHPLHGFCTVFSCFRSGLSGDVRHWRWLFFIFLVGVRRRR